MTAEEVTGQLDAIASDEDFPSRSDELTEHWASTGAGLETVQVVLRFMESHPDVDYGTPGALVHFCERFYRNGYEERLLESIRRKPTAHTAWMLNRLINGTQDQSTRRSLVDVMVAARDSPHADQAARNELARFVAGQIGARDRG